MTREPASGAIPEEIFRAYDIRGLAGSQLTPANIHRIGAAMGRLALEQGRDTLLLGADARLSSAELAPALRDGILASGCNVVDLGIVPTPLLYFACHTTEHDSGVMLTASHNPAEYNGVKMVIARHCLTSEQIQRIRELGSRPPPAATATGHCNRRDIRPAYLRRLTGEIQLERPLHVVLDCANAVPGTLAPSLFEALGCHITPLFCDLDGRFPNHPPDPTRAGNRHALIERILAEGADVGLAFDGDGDRVVVVTNAGTALETDRLLMLFVRDILPDHRGAPVVFDVKSSQHLAACIAQYGGRPVMSRSGHSFIKQSMQETGAILGGEYSAHVFFGDRWHGFDDGLYVGARFLELLARGSGCAESLCRQLPHTVCTPELPVPIDEARKFVLMERICELAEFPGARVNRLDGIRAEYPDGWGLIRASNTSPALLLRFEADTPEALQAIQRRFRHLLNRADSELDPGF